MNSITVHDATTSGNRPIIFSEFVDVNFPESIPKFFLRFLECSSSERSLIESTLKDKGVEVMGIDMGVQGQDSLGLIFPRSSTTSDSCRCYLESMGVKVESPRGCSLGQIAGILLRHQ